MQLSEVLQIVATIVSTLASLASLCGMLYMFSRFLAKPHNDLESRIAVLEAKQKEIDQKLERGNKRFSNLGTAFEVMAACMLNFMDFEVEYCNRNNYDHTENLTKARDVLNNYLAKNKGGEEL